MNEQQHYMPNIVLNNKQTGETLTFGVYNGSFSLVDLS